MQTTQPLECITSSKNNGGLSYRMTWNYYGYKPEGAAFERDTGAGADSNSGFQRKHDRVRAAVRLLSDCRMILFRGKQV
jgi:hypothetical protein